MEGDEFGVGKGEVSQGNLEDGWVQQRRLQGRCSKEIAEKYLTNLETEKESKVAFKIQLGLRQKVLSVDCNKNPFK